MLFDLFVSKFLARFNIRAVILVFILLAVFGLVGIGLGLSKGTNTAELDFTFRAIIIGFFAFSFGARIAYAAYKYKSKQGRI